MSDGPAQSVSVSFVTQVKPLFRPHDRESMKSHFDLWVYDDVSTHADAIITQLRAGRMPCDGAWPPEQLDIFQQWIDTGKLP